MDAFDVLRGDLSRRHRRGAPKVRAMEIIEELESVRREVTAGRSATSPSPATWTLHRHQELCH